MIPLIIQGDAKKGLREIGGLASRVVIDIYEHADETILTARGVRESDKLPSSLKTTYVRLDITLPGDSYSAVGVRWCVDGKALKKALAGTKPAELAGEEDRLEVTSAGSTAHLESDRGLATQLLYKFMDFESAVVVRGLEDLSRHHSFAALRLAEMVKASPVSVVTLSPAWIGDVPAMEVEGISADGRVEWHGYVAGVG